MKDEEWRELVEQSPRWRRIEAISQGLTQAIVADEQGNVAGADLIGGFVVALLALEKTIIEGDVPTSLEHLFDAARVVLKEIARFVRQENLQ